MENGFAEARAGWSLGSREAARRGHPPPSTVYGGFVFQLSVAVYFFLGVLFSETCGLAGKGLGLQVTIFKKSPCLLLAKYLGVLVPSFLAGFFFSQGKTLVRLVLGPGFVLEFSCFNNLGMGIGLSRWRTGQTKA